jgi:hypothetical protein
VLCAKKEHEVKNECAITAAECKGAQERECIQIEIDRFRDADAIEAEQARAGDCDYDYDCDCDCDCDCNCDCENAHRAEYGRLCVVMKRLYKHLFVEAVDLRKMQIKFGKSSKCEWTDTELACSVLMVAARARSDAYTKGISSSTFRSLCLPPSSESPGKSPFCLFPFLSKIMLCVNIHLIFDLKLSL